jgi:hypothetical protein
VVKVNGTVSGAIKKEPWVNNAIKEALVKISKL